MFVRMLAAATICLVACGPVAASDLPIVLGEPEPDLSGAAPGTVLVEEGVPTEPPAVSVVVDENPPPVTGADELGLSMAGAAVSCADEPVAWSRYTTVDALFMQRPNTVGPLAVENQAAANPGAPVITAGDVRYPTSPGLRVFQGWRGPDCTGFEVGYLGIWSMHADALAVSPANDLALPGQLGVIAYSGLDTASAIAPTLNSTLNSAEFNVFATRVHDGCQRHDPLPWRRSWRMLADTVATADWLLGIRWAGLDEQGSLAVTALANSEPQVFNTTAYRVTSSSQFVGPQLGHRRRVEWGDWAFEGWAKAALAARFLSASQSAVIGPFDLEPIRGPQTASRFGVGMIGDLNATIVRRLGDHWGVRAGYTLLWLADAAPAANQWDFSNTTSSGSQVGVGSVFLHGATLGLEAAW